MHDWPAKYVVQKAGNEPAAGYVKCAWDKSIIKVPTFSRTDVAATPKGAAPVRPVSREKDMTMFQLSGLASVRRR